MAIRIRWRGLRFKIIAWALAPMALVLLAVGLWNLWSFYAITQALMIEGNRTTTELMAGRVLGALGPVTRQLETVARELGTASGDPDAQRTLLKQMHGSLTAFDAGVVLLDKQGLLVAADPERPGAIGQDWSNRPYFREMSSSPGTVLSDIVADGIGDSDAVAIAVPVFDPHGDQPGMVAGMFRVAPGVSNAFSRTLSQFVAWQGPNYLVSRGPVLAGFFVDGGGRVIYHSDTSQIGGDVSSRRVVQLVSTGRVGPISSSEFQLDGTVSYFSPVPGTSWGLVIEQSPLAVISFYTRYFVVQSLLFALAIAIPAIVVAVAASRITEPIGRLIAATQEVANGHFGQRVAAQTHDELEDLAEQFNVMSTQVDKSYSELKAREERLASLIEATNRQNAYLAALHETTLGIVSHLDTMELLQAIVERATQLVESLYGWVYLVTADKRELEVRVGTGFFHRYVGLRLSRGEGLAGAVWQTGEPIAVDDYQAWPRRSPRFEGDPVGPGLGVPLKAGGETIGAIGLTRQPGRSPFSKDELALMTRFAQLASIALENARLHTSLQAELAIEAGQRQFLELLAREGDFAEILHTLVRIVEGQWPGMLGLILLLDEDGKHLHIGASVSLPKEYVDSIEGLEIGPMVGSCGTACYRRERVIVEDIATDPRWEGLRELGLKYGLRACWSQPVLIASGQVAGTFAMYYRQPRAPTPQELDAIQTAAHLVGIAEDRKRARQSLQSAYQDLERRVEERTRELSTLNSVAVTANRSLDLGEILSEALEKTMRATGMEYGRACRLDGNIESAPEARLTPVPDAQAVGRALAARIGERVDGVQPEPANSPGHVLTPLVYRGFSEEFVNSVGHKSVPADSVVIAGLIGQPFVYQVEESVSDCELRQAFEAVPVRQIVSIPLVALSRIVGALNLCTAAPRTFTPDQLAMLSSIGQQVGMAVENARLYQAEKVRVAESERRRQVAEGLRDLLATLNSTQSLDEILGHVVDLARELLGSDAIAIFQLDNESNLLRVQASTGLDPKYASQLLVPIGRGAVGRTIVERQPVAVQNTDLILRELEEFPIPGNQMAFMARVAARFRTIVGIPLVLKQQAYGALGLYYYSPHSVTDEETKLAVMFADEAALAIENARLRGQAEQAATATERTRLARELHDSVTQSLYSVTLYTEATARLLKAGRIQEATSHLHDMRQTSQDALREMRLLIFQLRPPALETSSLSAAIQARLDAVESRGGVQATLEVIGEERLSRPVQEELYHIAQEALNNALKYARAQKVHVELRFEPGMTCLEVCDDGAGFEPELARLGGGFGIMGMHERAAKIGGSLSVESAPGKGTRVSVRVPIQVPIEGGLM